MALAIRRPDSAPVISAQHRSIYDYVPAGVIEGIFFRLLLLVAPIQSLLLTPVQGSTPAFILILLSPMILIGYGQRHIRLVIFYAAFLMLYSIYLACSLSGMLIDQPDLSNLSVIREVYIYGYLRQTHITQGVYLLAAVTFCYLIYTFWQESFVKYMYYGIIVLSIYGFYLFVYFAIFHLNGDFLSNRNFGDLNDAAAGAGEGAFATGAMLQGSNVFGSGFMRLNSLTGEPSMYALSVTPFAVYAFGRRWWWIFAFLTLSLALSTSSTAVIGLLVGLVVIEMLQRQEAVLYVAAAAIVGILLYATAPPVHDALDILLFQKLDTVSGNLRLQSFLDHARVSFDGNPVRALFGLGFGTVRATDMLSNLLANVGILGLFLYSALLLGPCFLLRGAVDRNALIATLLAIFAMEILTVSEYAYLPPWFMVAMSYARARGLHSGAPVLVSAR